MRARSKSFFLSAALWAALAALFPSGAEAATWAWHGYFSWFYQGDTRTTTKPAFDQFALALIPKVLLNDEIDLTAALVIEHAIYYEISVDAAGGRSLDRRSSGELTLHDAYLTYKAKEWLKVRAGKFATPFGIWNTFMYADPTYPSARQPGRDTLYSRSDEPRLDNVFFQRYGIGAWALGNWNVLSYDLYVTNGRTRLAQHVDDNDDKGVGGRLGVKVPVPGMDSLQVLYSAYQDSSSTAAVGSGFMKNQSHAVSLEATFKDINFQLEYANATRGSTHMDAFHTMIKMTFMDRVTPFVRYEYIEPNMDAGTDRVFVHGGGIQYDLVPGESFAATFKAQVDRVASEHGAPDSGYASRNYNRFFVGVGAGF